MAEKAKPTGGGDVYTLGLKGVGEGREDARN